MDRTKKITTAKDVAKIFEEIAPLDSGVPGDELGFVFGDPEIQVTGLGCVWCVHLESIQQCIENNINMIICHESAWLYSQTSPWYNAPDDSHIIPNQKRRELLKKHGITVYRSHSNWDALPVNGIADSAVTALGIAGLKTISRQKFFSVMELPKTMTIQELQKHVETGLGYGGCRLFGNKNKQIDRFAFLIGGFGENQLHMPQTAMELGAEAIIIGEMSEFIVLASLDMGLPVIESLHSVSEIPGIKRQAAILTDQFPELPVKYVPSGITSI
ncbi:MAG: Nif3-like dinuclear metal center hexameric protein [Bacteroidetes bacterium]|nr:Nif3-like dinuclear metal center hexameric protein [Bacteroidota bacterium]